MLSFARGAAPKLVCYVAKECEPIVVVESPVAAEPNDNHVCDRIDVDVLSEVAEGVEAVTTLAVQPPEVAVRVVVVSRRLGRGGGAEPLLLHDPLPVPAATVLEKQAEAREVARRGVEAALHLLESRALGIK